MSLARKINGGTTQTLFFQYFEFVFSKMTFFENISIKIGLEDGAMRFNDINPIDTCWLNLNFEIMLI